MASVITQEVASRTVDNPVRLLLESGALRYGEFLLASGKRSQYYIDSKKLTLYPEGARFVGTELVRLLDDEGIRFVGGVAYGAIPIVAHVALVSDTRWGDPIQAFYIRKDSKEHGTGEDVEGQLPPLDEPVAILEDVVTSGGSLLNAIGKAEANGYNVTHAITLVDRDEGGREAVEAAGYEFLSLFRVVRSGESVEIRYVGR